MDLNMRNGVIDITKNPFTSKDWIKQCRSFTPHRRRQAEDLLHKTIEEIRSIDANSGSYPAFVAIRWGYAEIKDNRLIPTANWSEWRPSTRKSNKSSQKDRPNTKKDNVIQRDISTRRTVSNSKRYDVMRRDKFQCALCGASGREAKLEIDHIIPVSRGGTDDISNLRCLCFQCNRGKHAKIELIIDSDTGDK